MKTPMKFLSDKYKVADNAMYFDEPDLQLNTSIDNICKYMQEYAAYLANEPKTSNAREEVCDCTHKQACKLCAESKDIDWRIIEGSQT